MSDGDVFSSFYSRLRDIREYHAKFVQDEELVKHTVMDAIKPVMSFSGEESMGRCASHDWAACVVSGPANTVCN